MYGCWRHVTPRSGPSQAVRHLRRDMWMRRIRVSLSPQAGRGFLGSVDVRRTVEIETLLPAHGLHRRRRTRGSPERDMGDTCQDLRVTRKLSNVYFKMRPTAAIRGAFAGRPLRALHALGYFEVLRRPFASLRAAQDDTAMALTEGRCWKVDRSHERHLRGGPKCHPERSRGIGVGLGGTELMFLP
jgi:hypothetical protein